MRRRLLLAILAALTLSPPAGAGGPGMLVGATEDNVKATDLDVARANMDLAKLAGLESMRVTEVWFRGQTKPDAHNVRTLSNVATAAKLDGIRILLNVFPNGSSQTPETPEQRAQFVSFTTSIVRAFPSFRLLSVGNEPNLNRFWLPQFGPNGEDAAAAGYTQLLAETYDAVKAAAPGVVVVGGALAPRGQDCATCARQTHSPTRFILDMGAAYRASGRTKPIMDAFAFHPYEENSSLPPTFAHPNSTTIAIADYGKLVGLLGQAFDGTAQRGSTLPIYYTEFGVETQIPPAQAKPYGGREIAAVKPTSPATQAAYYRQAVQLAFCQPNVRGLFFFHTVDESDLNRFQSGLYYAGLAAKPSRAVVRAAARDVRGGTVARCPALALRPSAQVSARGTLQLLRCSLDCSYSARLLRGTRTIGTTRAVARAGELTRLRLPQRLQRGSYRLVVTVRAQLNAGAPVAVSRRFAVR